ncbi:alpha/beta fold hydrolase [Muricoccus aerilatus]|uniref:alpha/beta fold hydrolase n=1 Tax=Muricoccus aerilatus TaxID=452982 RepID=UPI001B8030AD|nr:alpha/beta fold hydrolase [Roseomonas aerilata]
MYDILTKDGYEVLVVQNPTITLQDDVAVTRRAIAKAKHPVVLVGHSYGGSVIIEADNDPKVRSLVYLAAFAPDGGEAVAKLAENPPPGEPHAPLLPPDDGFLIVDPAKFPAAFAADVDASTPRRPNSWRWRRFRGGWTPWAVSSPRPRGSRSPAPS